METEIKKNNNKIINLRPSEFFNKLVSRGYKFNEELKNDINTYLKNIRNEIDNDANINNFEKIKKSYHLFKHLKNYNIDPKIYMLIFFKLEKKNIINLYRYINIKWHKLKLKYDNNIDYSGLNFEFDKIYDNNKNLSSEVVQKLFLINMEKFIDTNKLFIIFFVNIMQEYLCPS